MAHSLLPLMWFLLWSAIDIHTLKSSSSCPPMCSCREGERQHLGQVYNVLCGNKRLKHFPDLNTLTSVQLPKNLDLKNNNINESLNDGHFGEFANIVSLDLSNNENMKLSNNAFYNLGATLKKLTLENIGLAFNRSLHILDHLVSLEILSLSNNNRKGRVPGAEEHITENLFSYLVGKKLAKLKMMHCGIRSLSALSFSSLKAIQELDLSNNYFHKVPEAVRHLATLQTLKMSFCNIESISESDFVNLPNLKILDLSKNGKLHFIHQSAFRTFHKSLESLIIERCNLSEIPSSALFHLEKLKYLDVSGNNLKRLPAKSLLGSYCLETLLIGSKGVAFETNSFSGQEDCIERLSIKHMGLSIVPQSALQQLKKLDRLELDDNSFTELPKDAFYGVKANILSLSNNPITTIKAGAFSGLPANLDITLRQTKITDIDFLQGYPNGHIRTVDLKDTYIECKCSMKQSLNVTSSIHVYGTCRKGVTDHISLISSSLPELIDKACEEENVAQKFQPMVSLLYLAILFAILL